MSEAPTESTAAPPAGDEIKVTVKSSADQKYTISVSPSLLVSDFKQLLEPQCNIPKDRQRLIYSGRVLKDHETLATYKIQSGHTIHLVKSAAPPTSSAPSASAAAQPSNPTVPQNIAAGQGIGNPLAGLTGARYAGLAQLPSASLFGPDGGMGPPPSEEQLIQAMSSPMFQQSMNQMLQNPQMLDYIINSSPNLQGMGPQVRQMMQSEQFRQMMTNPDVMRQMMNLNRMFGANPFGSPGQGNQSFPEPGRTSTTETSNSGDSETPTSTGTATGANASPPANPFASLFPGGLPNAPASGNPFGALFNNPMLGAPPAQGTDGNNTGAGGNAAPNPLFSPEMLSLMMGGGAPAPEDNRPPEERYEAQLRQLNELGFFDFDRNVRALRRSGGNVQGAVEALLDGTV
ncbi:hypothetical protein POJ06DRAFT_248957 [Lipomyces tetrasporus]|uniref:Uncharacterized protein n=1 Tax=Lipomyces tetrasporus TaxID=54092 RepID=A0AAD7VVF5_9ASCO|nr:uncharacterized protein POJ06DRAFT_248957 [Lipomyces tetrasporus]KAJ8102160.1 hypothetical protein POJ06DRAFT_248957 [Lipomyces tetrasporus]